MRRKLSVWLLPTLLAAIFLIPMSAFASEVEINDLELELLNLGFEPLDMNEDYIIGTTAPNNKIYFYERATGTTYNVGFTDPYTFVRDVDMKVQGRYFYFTTYQYAGYSEHDYTIMRYDLLTDSSEELIYNPKIITIQGVSDSGLIYTQDNIIYGNELYYYDFRTGKETHLASKVGSAHMSGNIITYSVVSSNIMERNESVYYVQTNALTNKIPVPYGGEYVKTNGKYIAYWYNNSFLSNERTVLIYNISTKEVYDYSYYYEGDAALRQNIVFAGGDFALWNSVESQNPNGTTGYDLQNDVRYYFSRSYMPIAATENEAIFYSPSSYDYYYLDFSNLSGGGGKTAYDYFNEGVTLYNQQKYQDAIAQFDQAISLYSGDERFYLYKGYALYYLGKYQDAITAFDNSLKLTESEEAYYFKAKSLFELKRYTESRAIILIVISYNNQSPEYYSYLGTILINLGQYQDALDAYNNALRINPSYPEAVAGKDQVEDLINDGDSKQLPSKSNVPLDYTFTIKFNTAVNKNTVNSSNVQVYEVSTGQLVPISILSGSNPNAISFKPVTNYKPSNLYRVTVKKDVKSTSGKALTQNVEMTFTTVSQGPVYGEEQKLDEMEELEDKSTNILTREAATEGLKDINGTVYENGFYIGYFNLITYRHYVGLFSKEYNLGGNYKKFTATVVPSYAFNYITETFNDIGRMKIYGDGQLLYDSGIISSTMKTPKQIDINLQGVNRLKIEVKNGISLGFFNTKLYN